MKHSIQILKDEKHFCKTNLELGVWKHAPHYEERQKEILRDIEKAIEILKQTK